MAWIEQPTRARRQVWLAAIMFGALVTPGGGAEDARPEKTNSTLLQLLPLEEFTEPRHHILDAERQPARQFGDEKPTVHSIYFPPNPPPLGVDLALTDIDTRVGAPADLAPYVMELFYAPLSTRIIERSLTRSQRTELTAYAEKRDALVAVLRQRLEDLATVGESTRRAALEELAEQQAPALQALEQEADRLRTDFYSSPLSRSAGSWYTLRSWKLGRGRLELPRDQTLFLEYQLLRAAAFYQEGLSLPQRRLLRECAITLEAQVFPGSLDNGPKAEDWFWFFSPHLARVHLDEDLPADVQALIATYRQQKEALKRELRDAIYENDGVVFESTREPILRELAEAQAPRLAALEKQAEHIRSQLAVKAPVAIPPPPPPLSAELQALIDDYRKGKRSLELELADELRRAVRHMIVPDGYASGPSLNDWREARASALDEARQRFRKDHAAQLTALRDQHKQLRQALETWTTDHGEAVSLPRDSISFLAGFFAHRDEQQGQRDYHLAVFEPGLSPEQRRLLLGAAITEMNLPRPGPEDQPTTLPGTLLK